jgi:hypothetical protein
VVSIEIISSFYSIYFVIVGLFCLDLSVVDLIAALVLTGLAILGLGFETNYSFSYYFNSLFIVLTVVFLTLLNVALLADLVIFLATATVSFFEEDSSGLTCLTD